MRSAVQTCMPMSATSGRSRDSAPTTRNLLQSWPLAVLLLSSTLSVMAGASISPVLALIQDDLGIGNTAAGFVLTTHGLTMALAGPLVGRDRPLGGAASDGRRPDPVWRGRRRGSDRPGLRLADRQSGRAGARFRGRVHRHAHGAAPPLPGVNARPRAQLADHRHHGGWRRMAVAGRRVRRDLLARRPCRLSDRGAARARRLGRPAGGQGHDDRRRHAGRPPPGSSSCCTARPPWCRSTWCRSTW